MNQLFIIHLAKEDKYGDEYEVHGTDANEPHFQDAGDELLTAMGLAGQNPALYCSSVRNTSSGAGTVPPHSLINHTKATTMIIINSYLSKQAMSSWRTSFAGTRVQRKRRLEKAHPIQATLHDFLVSNFSSEELRLLQTNIDSQGSLLPRNAAPAKQLASLLSRLFAFDLWDAYEKDLCAIRDRELLEVIWQAENLRQVSRQLTAKELACWQGVFFALQNGIAAHAQAREIADAAPMQIAPRVSSQRL